MSRHTILSPIRNSESWFILNLLTGEADILEPELAEKLNNNSLEDEKPFIEKGYLMDTEAEESLYREKYLDFMDQQENAEVQIFYNPTYQCNFNCTYCYQEGYGNTPSVENQKSVMDSFFGWLDRNMQGRSFYLTLFGGEPLLSDPVTEGNIEYFLDRADERNLSLAVVTNGYTLDRYLPRLSRSSVREIQITLDGPPSMHNTRRPLRGGQATFGRIAENVSRCLEMEIPVNLRVVLDRDNLDGLVPLADYAAQMGWTASRFFKTQLGRNYELHTCQADSSRLFSRVEMYEALYGLLQKHPSLREFHKPAFSISRFLLENGELPRPLFDACPAAKTEWAFDYTGTIYPCTAMVGKSGEALGTFYPEAELDEERCGIWQDRDVRSIEECRSCSLQLACGGGCGAVAKNRTGSINAPDCRPVRELMEMGISIYFEQGETE